MSDQQSDDLEAPPGWKPGTLPPPPPAQQSQGLGQNPSESPTRPSPSPALRGTGERPGSSTRGSTETPPPPPPPPSNLEDFEDVGAIIFSGISKIVSYVVSRRSKARIDLQMSEGEARAVASPVVRLLVRRFHVNADVKDALDVGRSADSLLGYGLRVLMGAPAPGLASQDHLARQAADEAARAARARADLARQVTAQPPVDQEAIDAAARDAAARAAADGRRPHGEAPEDDATVLDLFEHMEDV